MPSPFLRDLDPISGLILLKLQQITVHDCVLLLIYHPVFFNFEPPPLLNSFFLYNSFAYFLLHHVFLFLAGFPVVSPHKFFASSGSFDVKFTQFDCI